MSLKICKQNCTEILNVGNLSNTNLQPKSHHEHSSLVFSAHQRYNKQQTSQNQKCNKVIKTFLLFYAHRKRECRKGFSSPFSLVFIALHQLMGCKEVEKQFLKGTRQKPSRRCKKNVCKNLNFLHFLMTMTVLFTVTKRRKLVY